MEWKVNGCGKGPRCDGRWLDVVRGDKLQTPKSKMGLSHSKLTISTHPPRPILLFHTCPRMNSCHGATWKGNIALGKGAF